jgi:D-alanyl-D-alanine carboxypeptidase/D-alanyl-D-alanine-endopeptidase (penicillin-binding protein 4)
MNGNTKAAATLAFLSALVCGCGGRQVLTAPPAVTVDSAYVRQARLAASVDSLLADSSLAQARCGLYIVDLDSGQVIYARDHEHLFTPASVNKIFTAAAALRELGPQIRFRTEVCCDSLGSPGKVVGNLYLKGMGDPLLSVAGLEELAFRLRSRGIGEIRGDLVADQSYLDTARYGAGWMWDDGPFAFNAPVSALSLNQNVYELGIRPASRTGRLPLVELHPVTSYLKLSNQAVTVKPGLKRKVRTSRSFEMDRELVVLSGRVPLDDSVQYYQRSVYDPVLYCGTVFAEVMERQGIKLRGRVVRGETPGTSVLLAARSSPPLYELIQKMNKESDNFIAEMLFRHLSRDSLGRQDSGDGEYRNGLQRMLEGMGFAPGSFRTADGSGLSRYDLCTPRQLVTVLRLLYQDPLLKPELLVSLPLAGADGTLYNRMQSQNVRWRVRAKTGTMTGVSCLAGLAWGAGDRVYCFAIMFNNYPGKAGEVRRVQDAVLEKLLEISP